jgi:hypothetical protein
MARHRRFSSFTVVASIGLIAIAAFWASECSTAAAAPSGGRAGSPQPVWAIRGQYCAGFAPEGYFIAGENPQGTSFGADVHRRDGRGGASYAVFGGGPMTSLPALATPESAVATIVSNMGQTPTRFGNAQPVEPGVMAVPFQQPVANGVALYRVLPVPGGFIIVLREAMGAPDLWARSAAELTAVARSLRCNVPTVPTAADPPARNLPRSSHRSSSGDEGNSQYNPWLGREYYHDRRTGQNFWVSPSQDWSETGPEGAGYYIHNGNDTTKLDSGYSQ